jgi:hypothetical protein
MSDTTLQHSGANNNNGILRKVWHNITLHRSITNRSNSNPRRFSRQSAAQGRLTHLQPHRTSLRLSGQQAAQDGLTCLRPCRISRPLRTTGCPGWTHSPAASPDLTPLWITGCPGQTHSPAASPDLCAIPDSQLPKMDSLACSFTGPLCASLLTNYPGTQTPVASRQRHITPEHLACHRMGSARHRQSTRPVQQRSSTPVIS